MKRVKILLAVVALLGITTVCFAYCQTDYKCQSECLKTIFSFMGIAFFYSGLTIVLGNFFYKVVQKKWVNGYRLCLLASVLIAAFLLYFGVIQFIIY